ncbi:hypothetical protein HUJ04_000649 [Dendroctonus ponderosae]|uniref:GDNF/GAS1 domain-containing protein n=1 Tax=Dendroctonus ponderosae TaxID=77166 RepID=A0AAR5QGF7_DENPD|nr:hypothetical protein HUJ04_003271 [Dendroctonus ponderosae]KAH0998904.1 hypothetical protein HUJ04_003271 [Dendroctonus ponderosae]KAH1011236.1 hypothetical protein HUJ04_000649 [Dendroctonus ponderosae]
MWWNILVTLLVFPSILMAQRDCSHNEYDRCIRIADPLIKEAHLVFPDNIGDIEQVCKIWNMFVDCLKAFTDNCFTDQERKKFNRAVESPIESIHQMCMHTSYQKEYLQYAPCIKSTIIERNYCGPHYNTLVDQAEQGEIISKSTLCCSHGRFKQCVLRETRRTCDSGKFDGRASKFASQILDKAFKFLQDQCVNYIPNSGDCISTQDSVISYSDRSDPSSAISTSSSEVYPWSTIQQEMGGREVSSSRSPKLSTSQSWLSSSVPSRADKVSSAGLGSIAPTQNLGTRTRPASYGRSNSWSSDPTSSSTVPTNTAPMFPAMSSTPTSFRDVFGTRPSWNVYSGINNRLDGKAISSEPWRPTDHPSTTPQYHSPLWNSLNTPTTHTWYPAAGNQMTNEVDEPNQLGLSKPENAACEWRNLGAMHRIFTICLIALRMLAT